jgi:hypothetical protein
MKNTIFAQNTVHKQVAAILTATILLWAIGAPLWIKQAHAAQLTFISDVLSDSDKGVVANHTFSFTVPTGGATIAEDDTIVLTFAPFDIPAAMNFEDVDVTVAGGEVTVAAVKSGASWGVLVNDVAETIQFTVGSGTVTAGQEVVIEIGTNATAGSTGVEQITNPSPVTAGGIGTSYEFTLTGTMPHSGATRVAIIDDVTMTASVDTTLTFNIYGTSTGAVINGTDPTYATSTATSLAFGTLNPTPGNPKVLGQRLTVETNAKNGFSVTVVQDQNLLSASDADIDLFVEGDATSTPQIWASPVADIADENTWGHYGLTSQDASLSTGDDFGAALFTGDFGSTTPREIFYHNGPADGTTQHQGETHVAFKIEINALQEAANDYSNTLTYVATPVF